MRRLDYALFCGDGKYNMDLAEAAECAAIVGARNNILIHTVPDAVSLFDRAKAEAWTAPNKLIIESGQEIELTLEAEALIGRLKYRNAQLRRRNILNAKRISVLEQIFKSPQKAEIRLAVMSLADEFVILQEEAELRKLARKREKAAKELASMPPASISEIESLADEIAVEGANVEGLVTVWYRKADGNKIFISVSEKLAKVLKRGFRDFYNNDQRHDTYRDESATKLFNSEMSDYFAGDNYDDPSETSTSDNTESLLHFSDDRGTPLGCLIRQEVGELVQLVRTKRTKELEEIKTKILAVMTEKQGLTYYYSLHEKLPNTKIADILGVSRQAVGELLKKAKPRAFSLRIDKLLPSAELESWYAAEKEKIIFYTKK